MNLTKTSSQLGSDTITSLTSISETTITKTYKKTAESKLYDDQLVEEVISKAPLATHAMLKVLSEIENIFFIN
jgi:hypothetical protein